MDCQQSYEDRILNSQDSADCRNQCMQVYGIRNPNLY